VNEIAIFELYNEIDIKAAKYLCEKRRAGDKHPVVCHHFWVPFRENVL
jgi:hypothetical protein